jgi:hypothetical protein
MAEFFTLGQTMALLNLSPSGVRYQESHGRLRTRRNQRGEREFYKPEVFALKRARQLNPPKIGGTGNSKKAA